MAVADDMGSLPPIALGTTVTLSLQCRAAATAIPTAPDAAPTWSIYECAPSGSDTAKLTGTLSASNADSKTGLRRGTAAITSGNGFAAGGVYVILYEYEISSAARQATQFFTVV